MVSLTLKPPSAAARCAKPGSDAAGSKNLNILSIYITGINVEKVNANPTYSLVITLNVFY